MGSTKVKEIKAEESVVEVPKEEVKEAAITKEKKARVKKVKQGKKYRSKKYLEKAGLVNKTKKYPLTEAVAVVKQVSYSKFPGSLEAHIMTNVPNIRGLVNLPFMKGKKLTILAFGQGAAESGADMVGDDEKLADIIKGKVDFDVVVTTAEWMPKLARAAKVLGPKGLMPNPKNGTVAIDLKKAVEGLSGGKFEYKSETKLPVVHVRVGTLLQPDEELIANIKTLLGAIGKGKVSTVKLAPTMGPGVLLDTQTAI